MKTVLKYIAVLLLLLVLLVVVLMRSPSLQFFILQQFAPDHDFNAAHAVAEPDYTDINNWLAHPDTDDNADWSPAGLQAVDAANARASVFFIHPTAYVRNEHWMGNLQKDTATDDNKQWMMANLASAYNGCCAVYAPYFREAAIHAFMQDDLVNGAPALDFAYQDVARAFRRFIEIIPPGSPFIVASHSQGTVHGQRLLQEEIDATPLVRRMVAAYLVGCTIHADIFDRFYQDIKACDGPQDLNCVNAWDTWGPDGDPMGMSCPNWLGDEYRRGDAEWLCVNPLSWRSDGDLVEASDNPGSVPVQNHYNISGFGEDKSKGLQWGEIDPPLSDIASAQCDAGVLRANDQSDSVFSRLAINGNYHGLDYALYYMSIRNNVEQRVTQWWWQQAD